MHPRFPAAVRRLLVALPGALAVAAAGAAEGPPRWAPASYPDEAGLQARLAGMLDALAAPGYGERSLARSTCPDTGLPVRTWALAGEEIISPHTGRRYRQGPTGYFGPTARDADGRITAFGGDPLKYDLPPVTVALLRDPADPRALAFLSIPGNTAQQYHFAAKHWARLLGLVGDRLPPAWHAQFWAAVAGYSEGRRPSDGTREHAPLAEPFDLVGRPDRHLGGGGTENHRLMWRTSAYLYAERLPDAALISGQPAGIVRPQLKRVLADWVQRLYKVGVGEWTSSTYYPHSVQALLNLYDFARDPEVRALAQAALDFYVLTYGLKRAGGLVTGAQRRGTVPTTLATDMDRHLWVWAPAEGGAAPPPGPFASSLAQATTAYRPNAVLHAILQHRWADEEALFRHPDYEMQTPAVTAERLWRGHRAALGSVQLREVNNSAQQVCWSLTVECPGGPVTFTGGQPRWRVRGGHSPHDQWLQHRNALLLVTGDSPPGWPAIESLGQLEGPRAYDRRGALAGALAEVPPPADDSLDELRRWWEASLRARAAWLWVSAGAPVVRRGADLFFDLGQTVVVVRPWRGPDGGAPAPHQVALRGRDLPAPGREPVLRALAESDIYVFGGLHPGFTVEVLENLPAGPPETRAELAARTAGVPLADGPDFRLTTADGRQLHLRYRPETLSPERRLNGVPLDEGAGWTYEGPFFRRAGAGTYVVEHPAAGAYRLRLGDAGPTWEPAP